MAVKVFVVDDHYMIIEGIHTLLADEQKIEWVGHATSAASCLAYLLVQQPDVVFMDINLPDKSGIELCKEVKAAYPSIMIIGLSTFNQFSFIRRMLDNGASGYVLKNALRSELIDAIETVSKGHKYLSHEAMNTLRNDDSGNLPVLTQREKEVLELIAEGYINQQIADKLFVSITTINTHRKNLLAKFEVQNTAALIKIAIDRKLI